MNIPGKMTYVTGSHAHFWLSTKLIVGSCRNIGLLKLFRRIVL